MPADTVRPPQAETIYLHSIEVIESLRSFLSCSVRLNVYSPMRCTQPEREPLHIPLHTFELFRETYVYSSVEAHSGKVSLCTFLCILLNLRTADFEVPQNFSLYLSAIFDSSKRAFV